jgi:tetratricopeptide (TPR) repeat protein
MKLTLLILTVLAGFGGQAAGQGSEFAAGRTYYVEGEFRKAAAHFQLALRANPDNAETCYWTGISYRMLADIATPFGSRYNSKAREYLTKAMELAPSRPYYRQALFDFLLDSADSSRTALRDAAGILLAISESDPDYSDMRRRLEDERKVNSSANAHLGRLFLTAPRAAYRIAALPASALSSRRVAASLPPAER